MSSKLAMSDAEIDSDSGFSFVDNLHKLTVKTQRRTGQAALQAVLGSPVPNKVDNSIKLKEWGPFSSIDRFLSQIS